MGKPSILILNCEESNSLWGKSFQYPLDRVPTGQQDWPGHSGEGMSAFGGPLPIESLFFACPALSLFAILTEPPRSQWQLLLFPLYQLSLCHVLLQFLLVCYFKCIHVSLPELLSLVTGITCLFIAAKVEEIYPPKIAEFAFVTDGACSENEILDMELVILKVPCFELNPELTVASPRTFLP